MLLAAVQKGKHLIFTNLNDKLQKHLACVGMEHFKYVSSVDEAVRMYDVKSATPSIRFVSTGDEGGSETAGEMAFEADDAVENPRFLKALSIQPSFYADIPITVGNISKVGGKEDSQEQKPSVKGKNKQISAAPISPAPIGSGTDQPPERRLSMAASFHMVTHKKPLGTGDSATPKATPASRIAASRVQLQQQQSSSSTKPTTSAGQRGPAIDQTKVAEFVQPVPAPGTSRQHRPHTLHPEQQTINVTANRKMSLRYCNHIALDF